MSNPQAEDLKTKGNAALSAQKYDEAIKLYTQAIELDPKNQIYYSNRSAAYGSSGKYQEALDDAEKAISLAQVWAKGYQRKGFALYHLKRYQEAVQAYQVAINYEPNSQQIKDGLTEALEAFKRSKGRGGGGGEDSEAAASARILQEVLQNLGDPVEKCRSMPETAHLADDQEFIKVLKEIKSDPNALQRHISSNDKVQLFFSVAFQREALSKMNHQERSEMLRRQEEERIRMEKAEEAERDRRRKQEKERKEAEERKKKEVEDAKLSPEQKEAVKHKEEGNKFYQQKNFDAALAEYNKAHELDSNNPVYLNNIAAVHLEKSDYQKCIETCEKAIELGRSQRVSLEIIARALSRIGNAYLKQNDYPKAIEYYKKAMIEFRDKATLASLHKAEKLLEEKNKKDYFSAELSQKAREEGNALFKAGKFPEAVEKYAEAIKRNPGDPLPYSNRATAYTKLGALPEALRDCNSALELDPKFIKAYLKKGNIHFIMKEYQKAFKTYEEARKYEPDNVEINEAIEKTMMAVQRGQQDPESVKRNIENDPELQAILTDPVMQQVLNDLKNNPQSFAQYAKDPKIGENIKKLLAAGVLGTR